MTQAAVHSRVSFVFSGHDHLYQRGEVDGLKYVVSGGGGAPLYSVRCGAKGKPRCKQPLNEFSDEPWLHVGYGSP